MSNEKVYENQKMLVEVDGIDTVFVTNKVSNSMVSVQVNEEEGFHVIYTEEEEVLSDLFIFPNGDVNIVIDSENSVSEDEELPVE